MVQKTKFFVMACMAAMLACHPQNMLAADRNDGNNQQKTVMNNILTRTSVRTYQARSVEKSKIDTCFVRLWRRHLP